LEDLGDTADKENIAKKYVDGIRVRKVLPPSQVCTDCRDFLWTRRC